MTAEEILALREARGWASPLRPLEPGERVLMFSSRGVHEWMMHPDDTLVAVLEGVEVEGLLLEVQIVDCFPLMNAFMVRGKDPEANAQYIPPHRVLSHSSKHASAEFIPGPAERISEEVAA